MLGSAAAVLAATALLAGGSHSDWRDHGIAPNPFYGVAPQTELSAGDYDRMALGGVGVLRVPFTWEAIQTTAGPCLSVPKVDVCNWTVTDDIVGKAAARGIRVLPTLGGRPEFTLNRKPRRDARERPPTRGQGLEAWRSWVRAAAERYGHGGAFWDDFTETTGAPPRPIEHWQIWNEPNSAAYWPPRPRPRQYARLVKSTSNAIREADPQAEIVLGGLFGTATVRSRKFLRRLYEVNGISRHFDAVAIHPYSPNLRGIKLQVRWLRRVARRAGHRDVGLWATELGWSSGRGGHPLEKGPRPQARMLGRAFRLLERRRAQWNVEGVVWFTWRDRTDHKVCTFCRHAGLFDSKGRPKTAWQVFQRFARQRG